MKKKVPILFIHGGMTFKKRSDYLNYLKTREISLEDKKRWIDAFFKKPLNQQFELIKPRMPRAEDAHYDEWAIHFKRYLTLIKKDFILIGASLGGLFLAKFLSENKLPRKSLATYLVCPPYDGSLSQEDLVGGFKLPKNLSGLEKNSKKLYLFFSADDPVVPIEHAQKYKSKLKSPIIKIYKSKNGHFLIPRFPELIKIIKADLKTSR